MKGSDKRFQDFVEFLVGFINDLNDISNEGAVVLVEGRRDAEALSGLGYTGAVVTKSALARRKSSAGGAQLVVILTDLDAEGRRLAAWYIKYFGRRGVETSLNFTPIASTRSTL